QYWCDRFKNMSFIFTDIFHNIEQLFDIEDIIFNNSSPTRQSINHKMVCKKDDPTEYTLEQCIQDSNFDNDNIVKKRSFNNDKELVETICTKIDCDSPISRTLVEESS